MTAKARHAARQAAGASSSASPRTAAPRSGARSARSNMFETPRIETRRLILRPLALSDAAAIQRHFNNWNVIRTLATVVPWPYPDDGAESFIKRELDKIAAGEESYQWVLV